MRWYVEILLHQPSRHGSASDWPKRIVVPPTGTQASWPCAYQAQGDVGSKRIIMQDLGKIGPAGESSWICALFQHMEELL